MSYYSHTILKCTKPDIIASGSTFVSETESIFHETINGQSHFYTWRNTMDDEIVKLSTRHPEETFTTECHWDNESPNSLIYKNEFNLIMATRSIHVKSFKTIKCLFELIVEWDYYRNH